MGYMQFTQRFPVGVLKQLDEQSRINIRAAIIRDEVGQQGIMVDMHNTNLYHIPSEAEIRGISDEEYEKVVNKTLLSVRSSAETMGDATRTLVKRIMDQLRRGEERLSEIYQLSISGTQLRQQEQLRLTMMDDLKDMAIEETVSQDDSYLAWQRERAEEAEARKLMAEYAERIRRGDGTLKQSELDAVASRLKIGSGESYTDIGFLVGLNRFYQYYEQEERNQIIVSDLETMSPLR
jgi:hypothetical protein